MIDLHDIRIQIESDFAINLELFGMVKKPPLWTGNAHSHPFWEIIYIKQGSGTLTYGAEEVSVHKGSVLVLEPKVVHKFNHDNKEVVEHLYIGFSFISESAKLIPQKQFIPLVKEPFAAIFEDKLKHLAEAVSEMGNEAELNSRYGEVIVLVSTVVKELFWDKDEAQEDLNRFQILANKAKEYIKANIAKNITIDEIASMFYLSSHYFGDIFKKETGMSLKEYHTLLRMKEAALLLNHKDANISDIAKELGFSSIHYFSRKFKQFYGKSPVEYRKLYLEK